MSILIPEYDQSNVNAPFKSNIDGQKSLPSIHLNPKIKRLSPAGNEIPVSRVTGGDTRHYTTEGLDTLELGLMGVMQWGYAPFHFKVK